MNGSTLEENRRQLAILLDRAQLQARRFETAEALRTAKEALAIARVLEDQAAVVQALGAVTIAHYVGGDHAAAVGAGMDALELERGLAGNFSSHALFAVGMSLLSIGMHPEAINILRRGIAKAAETGDAQQQALNRSGLGFALAEFGHYAPALRELHLNLRAYAALDDGLSLAKMYSSLGRVWLIAAQAAQKDEPEKLWRHRYAIALAHFGRVGAMAPDAADRGIVARYVAEIHLELGRADEAGRVIADACTDLLDKPIPKNVSAMLCQWRGIVLQRLDRADEAVAWLEQGADLARRIEDCVTLAGCHEQLAAIHAARGNAAAAGGHAEIARATRVRHAVALNAMRTDARRLLQRVGGIL